MRVYDGDTIWSVIDLGFKLTLRNEPLRLYRVDTPEVTGAKKSRGILVRDLVAEKFLDQQVVICTFERKDGSGKKGAFHRYLAEIWINDLNVNGWLLEEGHVEFDDRK